MVRTRIAPSPTGFPHIGTIYQSLFDFAFARKNNGVFVTRIEDTDRTRFVTGAEEEIYKALDWFGLTENESPRQNGPYGPYRQSERLDLYKKFAQELIDSDKAYYCFCSKERLDEVRKKRQQEGKPVMYDRYCRNLQKDETIKRIENGETNVLRMKIPQDQTVTILDEIRGEIKFDSNTIDDQVLLKSDGFPTYHLAVVVDDHLMEITHVVRGEEWLTSTPKHFLLYDYFGWQKPLFFHTADLRNPDKSKLSKRHGHTNVNWYKENGFLPEALLNFLALLGWSHPEEKELFSLEEFTSLFDLKDIKPVGPIFDLIKLEWMNGVYIRERLSSEEIKKRITDFYSDDDEVTQYIKDNQNIDFVIQLSRTRMKTLKEFKELILETEPKHIYSEEEKKLAKDLLDSLETLNSWTRSEILLCLKSFQKEKNTSMKDVYILLTGKPQGLPLPDMMEKMKEQFINRLSRISKDQK